MDRSEIDIIEKIETKKTECEKQVTLDEILNDIGEFGLYQKFVYFLCSAPYILTSTQLIGWVFIGASVPFQCKNLPAESNASYNDKCDTLDADGNATACTHGYEFDTSLIKDSVTMEFELVCDRAKLHATIGAAPMVGYLFGGIIFGHLSDKFGRKISFLIANLFLLLAGAGAALAPEFFTFVATRVLAGGAIAGVEVSCFVMGMELVGKSKRTLAGVVCWFFETSGYFFALVLAYLINFDWRLLQMVYSLPLGLFFVYYWIVPESVRWLISKGKFVEAEEIISRSAHFNKVAIAKDKIDQMVRCCSDVDFDEERYSILTLFRHKNLRCKTAILTWSWIVCSALYYVLLLDQGELSDNKYIGFLLTTGVQIPGYLYILLILEHPYWGRKLSMCTLLISAGVCLFCYPMVENCPVSTEAQYWFRLLLSLIGRFCANCAFTILNLYSAEQFPTVVRSIGVGFTLVVSRVGTIMGPYLLLAGDFAPVALGFGAFTAGILSLLLPETLGQNLPETLQDGESIGLALPRCFQRKDERVIESANSFLQNT